MLGFLQLSIQPIKQSGFHRADFFQKGTRLAIFLDEGKSVDLSPFFCANRNFVVRLLVEKRLLLVEARVMP